MPLPHHMYNEYYCEPVQQELVKAQNLPLEQQILVQLIVCTLILSNNKLLILPVRVFHPRLDLYQGNWAQLTKDCKIYPGLYPNLFSEHIGGKSTGAIYRPFPCSPLQNWCTDGFEGLDMSESDGVELCKFSSGHQLLMSSMIRTSQQ